MSHDLRVSRTGTRKVPIAIDLHDDRLHRDTIGLSVMGLMTHIHKGNLL